LSNRRFGVEIECLVPRDRCDELERELGNKFGFGDGEWDFGVDGSVHGEGCCGHEIRTPPLKGKRGFNTLKRGFALLNKYGTTVNATCGMHVHHEATDLSPEEVLRFCKTWLANQSTMHKMVSPTRRNNGYCSPVTKERVDLLEHLIKHPQAGTAPFNQLYHGMAVNTSALYEHGTIEIRLHHGSVNYDEAEAWIKFGQGLIDSTMSRKRPMKTVKDDTLLRVCADPKAKKVLKMKMESIDGRIYRPV